MNFSLSVIIPAYREEESLKSLLPLVYQECKNNFADFEILVIGAREPLDKTQDVVSSLNAKNVRYIARRGGNEYGFALRTGIEEASKERLLVMDADGSHKPVYITELCKNAQYDLAIGSRYGAGGDTKNNVVLVFMSKLLNLIYQLCLGLKVKDISNSLRLYRADQLKSLSLTCLHFDIMEEILIKLLLKYPSLTVKEIPIVFEKRIAGKSKRSLVVFMLAFLATGVKLYGLKRKWRKENN